MILEVPEELQAVAAHVRAGEHPRTTVRTLLAWFRAERRTGSVVSQLHRALDQLGLRTSPDFEEVWIDASVAFLPVRETAPPLVSREADSPSDRPASTDLAPDPSTSGTTSLLAPAPAPTEEGTPAESSPSEKMAVLESEPVSAGPSLQTMAGVDPVHRVGKLSAANHVPVTVNPDALLTEAMTRMIVGNFSQLPVVSGPHALRGVISWESIGQSLALRGAPSTYVRECLVEAPVCTEDDDIFQVMHTVAERGHVLVLRKDRKLGGIVTWYDLTRQFGSLVEPFVLVGESENHVRLLLERRLPLEMLRGARDPRDTGRTVERAADLTFGEMVRLLDRPAVWSLLALPLHQRSLVEALERVRLIRNDVAHFHPDGLDASDLDVLRDVVRLLRALTERA